SLPGWVLRGLLAAAIVVAVGIAAWFALIKPAVQDTARETIDGPLASMSSLVDEALATTTTVARPTTTARLFGTSAGTPTDFQLAGTVPSGNSQTFSKSFDKDFALFDFVVQNPDGASGTVQILRNDDVLSVYALENIRDSAQLLNAPYVFN